MANLDRDIPEDVITVILSRLPVKSLLRCKSVCKSWFSIISNPIFIKSHLHNTIIASGNIPKIANIVDPDLFIDLQDVSYTCPVPIDLFVLPRFFLETLSRPQLVGSCNGIICLCDIFAKDIYLWNPSICKYMKIPPSPEEYNCCECVSFGYDSINDDYKVLKINYRNRRESLIIQVYSANANSWREFQSPIMQNSWTLNQFVGTIAVNGVLYIKHNLGLISFDLHTEVLGLVPFPSFIDDESSDDESIDDDDDDESSDDESIDDESKLSYVLSFKDSVAMLYKCVHDKLLYLWTLDDVSGQMTWVKKNSIRGNLELRLYLGTGLFLGVKTISGRDHNVLYNYEKKVTDLCGPLPLLDASFTLKYTESLISLDGFRQVE